MYKKLRLFLVSYLVAGCFDVVAIPAVRTHIILRLPLLASYSLFDMHSCVQRINTQDKLGLSKEQIANYAYAALLVNHTSVALGRSFDSSEAQGLIDQGLLEGELRDEVNPQVLSCIYNQAMKDPKFFDDTSQHSLALFFLFYEPENPSVLKLGMKARQLWTLRK
ncbi:hypothetical protein KBD08_04550 [Candidatus Babeliales bacterium]|nr:hypothetical protein [Candidatus Babeliales bacterium]